MATVRTLPPLDLRQRYTIEEACAYLRCSRARLYQHIGAARLETVQDGRRTYITGRVIAEFTERNTPSGGVPDGAEMIRQILETCLWRGGESPFEVKITDAEGTQTAARYRATKRGTFRLDPQPVDDLPLRSPTGELIFPLRIKVTDGLGCVSQYTIRTVPKPKTMIQ